MAARLPVLDGPGSGVRELFILFYFVTDDMCVRHHYGRAVVNRWLVDETRSCVHHVLKNGSVTRGTAAPGRLFHLFWRKATRLVHPEEHDRLTTVFSGLVDAMRIKYQFIAAPVPFSLEEFLNLRRRIPAVSFLELERALRAIPSSGAALVRQAETVADCLSWTNDLHSADKEQHEGFNLVHMIRRAHGVTLSEAKEEVEQLLITRKQMYKDACKVVRGKHGRESDRLLNCYDNLLAAIAPVHEQGSRYRA
ncbi:terpene synthase family protein [Streptomyces marokkonensis]|uniref:Terpene synthase family protein n=1 Tax=Streptomyces marokkonensis TaxID=324855 RepID=A0ABW6QG78_9ACTN